MILCDLTIDEIKKVASDYFKVQPGRINVELKTFRFDEAIIDVGSSYSYLNMNIRKGSMGAFFVDDNNVLFVIKSFPTLSYSVRCSALFSIGCENVASTTSGSYVSGSSTIESWFSNMFIRAMRLYIGPLSYEVYAKNIGSYILAYKITVIS